MSASTSDPGSGEEASKVTAVQIAPVEDGSVDSLGERRSEPEQQPEARTARPAAAGHLAIRFAGVASGAATAVLVWEHVVRIWTEQEPVSIELTGC
jgi:hypothetical protein